MKTNHASKRIVLLLLTVRRVIRLSNLLRRSVERSVRTSLRNSTRRRGLRMLSREVRGSAFGLERSVRRFDRGMLLLLLRVGLVRSVSIRECVRLLLEEVVARRLTK